MTHNAYAILASSLLLGDSKATLTGGTPALDSRCRASPFDPCLGEVCEALIKEHRDCVSGSPYRKGLLCSAVDAPGGRRRLCAKWPRFWLSIPEGFRIKTSTVTHTPLHARGGGGEGGLYRVAIPDHSWV